MKSFIVFLAILCFVNGRNLNKPNEERENEYRDYMDLVNNKEAPSNKLRHRRQTRRLFDEYNPYYYDRKRDYDQYQDFKINQIVNLLDEISLSLKRPPSPPTPPQIIYFPYPILQKEACDGNVSFPNRWPVMEDSRLNWGLNPGKEYSDQEKTTFRPITLIDILHEKKEPVPIPFDAITTKSTEVIPTEAPRPGKCQTAIIICCDLDIKVNQENCFRKSGCLTTYETGLACKPNVIQKVLDLFVAAYAPKNKR